jgi:hypothetical protein
MKGKLKLKTHLYISTQPHTELVRELGDQFIRQVSSWLGSNMKLSIDLEAL